MSSKSPTKQFRCENLDCPSAGRAVVLSAVRVDNRAEVFLKSGTPAAAVEPGIGAHLIEARSIANGPWLTLELAPGAPLQLRIDGQDHEIPTHAPDPDFLAGQNVLLGLRNAEDAKTVLDWLHYHAKHHGMTGALIISRHPAEA
ncbi:MAG: hypothetical protein OEZ19_07200, partial [Paracoccaceae bacterium]|nr:hypothetical protein [Paracoccaceae bacterium]